MAVCHGRSWSSEKEIELKFNMPALMWSCDHHWSSSHLPWLPPDTNRNWMTNKGSKDTRVSFIFHLSFFYGTNSSLLQDYVYKNTDNKEWWRWTLTTTTSPDTITSNARDESDDEGGIETQMHLEPRYLFLFSSVFTLLIIITTRLQMITMTNSCYQHQGRQRQPPLTVHPPTVDTTQTREESEDSRRSMIRTTTITCQAHPLWPASRTVPRSGSPSSQEGQLCPTCWC